VVTRFESDFQRGGSLPLRRHSRGCLKWLTRFDPLFDIIDATVAAEAVQFSKRFGVVRRPCDWLGYGGIGIDPWVDERDHRHQPYIHPTRPAEGIGFLARSGRSSRHFAVAWQREAALFFQARDDSPLIASRSIEGLDRL
jgi:hypothetical protein